MPYEKTISYEEVLYEVTITTDFTLIYDLLNQTAKDELSALLARRGMVLDGYIISYNADFQVKKRNLSGDSTAIELVLKSEKYTCPSQNWIYKTYVKASGANPAILRLFVTN